MVPSMRGGGGDYMQRRTPEAKGKIGKMVRSPLAASFIVSSIFPDS